MKPQGRALSALLLLISAVGCGKVIGLRDDYYVSAGGEVSTAGAEPVGGGGSGEAGGATSGTSGGGAQATGGDIGIAGEAGVGSELTMPPGKLVFERYTTYAAGDSKMFLVSFPDGKVTELGPLYGLCAMFNGIFSPDGRHLVVGAVPEAVCPKGTLDRNELEIFILDLQNMTRQGLQRVTDNNVPDEDPQYDTDGRTIFFKHGGYLASWVVGGTPFAETCASPGSSYCFVHSGPTEQSKPVPDGEGGICFENSIKPADPGGDIYCFQLSTGFNNKDITQLDNVTPAVTNTNIYDGRPVIFGDWLYYTRWASAASHINQAFRRRRKDLSQEQQVAEFCDPTHGYGDAFAIGRDGDLVVFSTTLNSIGKSDLFLGDFTQTGIRSLNDFVPGINTAQDELGAAYWVAPPKPTLP